MSLSKSKRPTDQPQMQKQTEQPPSFHSKIHMAHAHKVYYSGPLSRRIERLPDGSKPKKDEGWTEIWAQLSGTILSTRNLNDCQEVSKQGKEVPPSYINITEAVSYSFSASSLFDFSIVRRNPRCRDSSDICDAFLFQRLDSEQRGFKPLPLFMRNHCRFGLLGSCSSFSCLGEVPSRRNLHCSPN
jgi:hypothetical protein